MNIYDLANRVSVLAPGTRLEVEPSEFQPQRVAVPFLHNGAAWTFPEQVMEKIVGSAYEFRYWENPVRGTITFERLKEPLKDGRRTYLSPDRRDGFSRDVFGFWQRD